VRLCPNHSTKQASPAMNGLAGTAEPPSAKSQAIFDGTVGWTTQTFFFHLLIWP
jgi:hypothetical protein